MARTLGEPAVVDTHAHWAPPAYLAVLRQLGDSGIVDARWAARFGSGPLAAPNAQDLIASMDDALVDVAVVSIPPPGVFGRNADEVNVHATSRVNDQLLEVAELHAGRLRVWLTLPLPHVGAAMAELQRVGGHPLVAGVGLYSHTRPWCLDDEEFVPLFARIAESGLVAQMHPAFEPSEERYEPFALAGSLDAVFVNTLVVSRLIFGGLFDRAPDLRLIVTHLGGTLPFLVQRLHDMSAPFATTEKDIWSYCRKNLYFDNCSFHTPALVCTCATFGSDRVVLGSDFPFRGAVRRCVDDVDGGGFRTAERTAMLGRTALRLLSRR